ncbi:MAG: BlaI/MecI/CopY family transcriptional regulator [Ruminococcaceae bacterium]|nr:BlaI/MecI/CopY family transcriptional regulator [Oscillospiraceae bacterium]
MNIIKLGVVETQFANIIWENEPLASGELVKKCESILGWKKSTTYTVLKKLCEKGLFQNEGGMVSSLVSKEEYTGALSRDFVEETFEGSLPAFIAAFSKGKKLSEREVAEIREMIDKFGG